MVENNLAIADTLMKIFGFKRVKRKSKMSFTSKSSTGTKTSSAKKIVKSKTLASKIKSRKKK